MRKFIKRRKQQKYSPSEKGVLYGVLSRVWGLDIGLRAPAYVNHYKETIGSFELNDRVTLNLQGEADTVELIDLIKERTSLSLQHVRNVFCVARPDWLDEPEDDMVVDNAIKLACRLWLFIEPMLAFPEQLLADAIRNSMVLEPPRRSREGKVREFLSSDFSAKSLRRKAGIRCKWTSYLPEHLTFVDDRTLRVFRHARILHMYQSSSPEKDLYPKDFLKETEATLTLLFWIPDVKTARRTARLCNAENVDLETAMEENLDHDAAFDLSNYPVWRQRLEEVQRRYDASKPHTPLQWWYDRRNRIEWGALVIAVVVFILTFVFGVVSSVTGIIQANAALHQTPPP